jgi:hypothetical protein
LLGLFKDILPEYNVLPKSMNEAKKIVCPLELEVQKIHACVNDCMLYRGDYKDLRSCRICKHPRYKRRRARDKYKTDEEIKSGVPFKDVWYLPIIPRLKHLFANPREAKRLRWHHDERTVDKYMRHLKDGDQWDAISHKYVDFAKDPRNIRLGECTDGMNPFGDMSTQHSTWSVLLCIYNLAPWLCMKKKYIMLSMIIQGPKQPGNDIDIYFQLLVEELLTLWRKECVTCYDAYGEEFF